MNIENLRLAGKIHKEVEEYIRPQLLPNKSLMEICKLIENQIKKLTNKYNSTDQLNNGIAFPTGLSCDYIAAHYTPEDYEMRLNEDSVCKVDFGTHIDGNIIDSAFTICFKEEYNPILDASKKAVNEIIKNIGVDARINELGNLANEIVESYEFNSKPLKVIDNIFGHNILPYKIHGGKYFINVPNNSNDKVDENDLLAIEVYVSNGNGTTIISPKHRSTHFMIHKEKYLKNVPIFKIKKTKELFNVVKNNFKTLPFCPRFITDNSSLLDFNQSIMEFYNMGLISSHPPLIETDLKSKVAQFEHTIHVTENNVEILS